MKVLQHWVSDKIVGQVLRYNAPIFSTRLLNLKRVCFTSIIKIIFKCACVGWKGFFFLFFFFGGGGGGGAGHWLLDVLNVPFILLQYVYKCFVY